MPCESLDSREFSRLFLKFHFSISISSHFYFTFTSRSRFPVIFISLSFLEKSERDKNFTLFLEKKEWNFTPSLMTNLTILGSRVKSPKQIMSGIMNGDTQLFKIQQQIIQGSGFFYPYYPYLSLSQPSVPLKVWKAALLNFHSAQHQCHASHLGSLYLVSMQLKHEKPCGDAV